MPGKMSPYLENSLLQHILGLATMTFPTGLFVGLCTVLDENQDGASFTEVAASEYARQAVSFSAPSGLAVSNAAVISFGKATHDWGSPDHWIITDAASNGHVLFWGPITNVLSIQVNEMLEVDPAALVISLSGAASGILASQILNSVLRNQTWTLGTATYAALFAAYTNNSSYTEVTDSNYTRCATTWAAASGGGSSNTAGIQYPAAQAPYTATHVGIFTGATGGDLLFVQPLASSATVGAGKYFRLNIGDLTLSLD